MHSRRLWGNRRCDSIENTCIMRLCVFAFFFLIAFGPRKCQARHHRQRRWYTSSRVTQTSHSVPTEAATGHARCRQGIINLTLVTYSFKCLPQVKLPPGNFPQRGRKLIQYWTEFCAMRFRVHMSGSIKRFDWRNRIGIIRVWKKVFRQQTCFGRSTSVTTRKETCCRRNVFEWSG